MLGLDIKANKDEIRQAYKEYVRTNHPDRKGEEDREEFTEKFVKLSAEYERVMAMDDDEFWLESYDTGITRMATKRVDGPSLNPWERRFRQWAREKDILDVDELSDDVDCRKQAELYLDKCEEDPEAEGCEVEEMDAIREYLQKEPESKAAEAQSAAGSPSPPVSGAEGSGASDANNSAAQVFLSLVFGTGGLILVSFVAIVVNALKGD